MFFLVHWHQSFFKNNKLEFLEITIIYNVGVKKRFDSQGTTLSHLTMILKMSIASNFDISILNFWTIIPVRLFFDQMLLTRYSLVSPKEDLKTVRPLERLLLTANIKSSKQEKVAWSLAESILKNSENSGTIYVIKISDYTYLSLYSPWIFRTNFWHK